MIRKTYDGMLNENEYTVKGLYRNVYANKFDRESAGGKKELALAV
jgi:hypothetical protein